MTENEDYEFIAHEKDEEAWAVRFLKGDFIETVIAYDAIGFNEVKDSLTYSFTVLSSPDSELTPDNVDLQNECTKLLESIIISGIEDGTVQLKERDANES